MKKVKMFLMKKDNKPTNFVSIRSEDGELICYAEKRSMKDYIDECLHGNNETSYLIEKYERIKDGKDAILWGDNETNEIFITY